MDLRQIRTFVALYEEGRITRAASRLHVVQPAVSQQIKRLETAYGKTLFNRGSQGLTPNPLAHELYRHCIRVLAEVDRAHSLLVAGTGRESGRMHVGAQSSFHQFVMARALQTFVRLYPDVEVLSREGYRRDLLAWTAAGELDFSVVSTAQDLLSMQTCALASEALVVVGHHETLAGRDVMHGQELEGFRLVLPSRFKSLRQLIDAQFALSGIALKAHLEVDSLPSLLQTSLTPGWLSIVPPTALGQETDGPALQQVVLSHPTIRRNVLVAWPAHKTLETPARRFVQTLREILSRHSGVAIAPADGGGRPREHVLEAVLEHALKPTLANIR